MGSVKNSLTSVVYPSSATIGSAAFNANSLPDAQAFIYTNNTQTLVSYGGASKTPVVPSSTQIVDNFAFWYTGITSVDLPNGLSKVGSGAFYGNQLTVVTIPSTVVSIGEEAFASNPLTIVTFLGERPFVLGPGVFLYSSIPNGGIRVPSAYLASYHASAPALGVTTAKIVGY